MRSCNRAAALVPVTLILVHCSSNFQTAPGHDGGTNADTGHVADAGHVTKDSGHADSGKSSDAGKPAGGLGLIFTPSNVACVISGSALAAEAADAGFDPAMLADVDIMSSTAVSSDGSDYASLSSGVAYGLPRQSNGVKIGVLIAKSWTIEATATLSVYGPYPIALVASQGITVFGGIDGTTQDPPPGGYPSPQTDNSMGGGPGGGAAGSTNGAFIGAGGGSFC